MKAKRSFCGFILLIPLMIAFLAGCFMSTLPAPAAAAGNNRPGSVSADSPSARLAYEEYRQAYLDYIQALKLSAPGSPQAVKALERLIEKKEAYSKLTGLDPSPAKTGAAASAPTVPEAAPSASKNSASFPPDSLQKIQEAKRAELLKATAGAEKLKAVVSNDRAAFESTEREYRRTSFFNIFKKLSLASSKTAAKNKLNVDEAAYNSLLSKSQGLSSDISELDRARASKFVLPYNTKFYLAGREFKFYGFNSYDLFTKSPEDRVDGKVIDATFDALSQRGVKVVRTWAFDFGEKAWHGFLTGLDPFKLGAENQFKILDYILYSAARHDIKVILCFNNYWKDYGGLPWFLKAAGLPSDPDSPADLSRFFSDENCAGYYEEYLKAFLTRTNSFSKLKYTDDPAIFSLELMNEPRCPADKSGKTLRAWIDRFGAFIRGYDRNHMISAGLEGWDLLVTGSDEGTPFAFIHGSPYVSFATCHTYPARERTLAAPLGLSPDGFKRRIQKYLELSASLKWQDASGNPRKGKPFVVEEWNVERSKMQYYWAEMIPFLKQSNVSGFLIWNFFLDKNDGEFDVSASDRNLLDILQK